jgi:hypothetical protein
VKPLSIAPMTIRRAPDADDRWLVTLKGAGEMMVTGPQLRSFKRFSRLALERLHRPLAKIPHAEWSRILHEAMRRDHLP